MNVSQFSLHSLEFPVEFKVDNNSDNDCAQNGYSDNSGQSRCSFIAVLFVVIPSLLVQCNTTFVLGSGHSRRDIAFLTLNEANQRFMSTILDCIMTVF